MLVNSISQEIFTQLIRVYYIFFVESSDKMLNSFFVEIFDIEVVETEVESNLCWKWFYRKIDKRVGV